MLRLTCIAILLLAPIGWSEETPLPEPTIKYALPQTQQDGYVAQLRLHTPEEIEQVLKRVETLVDEADKYPDFRPVTFILHGPELRVFRRDNYQMYKHIVSLAARLEAFNAVDIQVCEVQMRRDGLTKGDLPAFVDSVPYGPDEIDKLLKQGYRYF